MKVFGTGMQRTGTTSLARALSMLGFATRDCPKELFFDIDHEILETFDAFTDNPVPLLYPRLDERHPGAKFVHTIRDEEGWLRSVKWLFTAGAEKFNWAAHDVFNRYHEELYGTTEYDEDVFRERYRRHNREVLDYFADRPDDLLVLDILAGDGFEKLCPFLGVPIPDEPFPHRNKQENRWKMRLRKAFRRVIPYNRDRVRR